MDGASYVPFPKPGPGNVFGMDETAKPMAVKGSDWTRLLTDSDLVSQLGKLLQTYREVPAEQRETALLQAMREIKDNAVKARAAAKPAAARVAEASEAPVELPHPEPIEETPPYEPDLFAPQEGMDRRRYQRIKCFVAVEIHVEGLDEPIWGNLANVSRGGCLVETASPVPNGKILEIGLWVASGKIWVKGVILSGVATRTASYGVRVRFSEAELAQKEHLREFLRFVENSTRKANSGYAYVAKLKG
jgi:hypothetical protein